MLTLLRSRRLGPLFWTQFFGSFGDNLLKSSLIAALSFGVFRYSSFSTDTLVNFSTALLVLPFFVFSALAGEIADRVDKATLIRALKLTELAVMLLAFLGFFFESIPVLLIALFLTGTQSAFFGPVKYSILPEHLAPNELIRGNGLIEMGTFVAILIGTIVGSLVGAIPLIGTLLTGSLLLLLSICGIIASRHIPTAPASLDSPIQFNLFQATRTTLRIARKSRSIWFSILGASWFWGIGAFVVGQLPRLAQNLGTNEHGLTWLLLSFSTGVGIGCISLELITKGRANVQTAALSSLAMGGAFLALSQANSLVGASFCLFVFGIFGGFLIIPLYAHMQHQACDSERSRVIAANNIINAFFMVGAAVYAMLRLQSGVKLSSLFLEVSLLHLGVTAGILILLRREMLRIAVGILIRIMYRIDARGFETHIPKQGAALLVANHISFIDAFLIGGLCERPIRFIMDHRMANLRGLRWLFRMARVIPIAPKKENPQLFHAAFEEIDRALQNGELVGIFPEGKCTRNGKLNIFKSGVEHILKRRPVPVIPISLQGLWGSFFSYAHGKPMRSLPRRMFSPVQLIAGPAMSPLAKASEMRNVISTLSISNRPHLQNLNISSNTRILSK